MYTHLLFFSFTEINMTQLSWYLFLADGFADGSCGGPLAIQLASLYCGWDGHKPEHNKIAVRPLIITQLLVSLRCLYKTGNQEIKFLINPDSWKSAESTCASLPIQPTIQFSDIRWTPGSPAQWGQDNGLHWAGLAIPAFSSSICVGIQFTCKETWYNDTTIPCPVKEFQPDLPATSVGPCFFANLLLFKSSRASSPHTFTVPSGMFSVSDVYFWLSFVCSHADMLPLVALMAWPKLMPNSVE